MRVIRHVRSKTSIPSRWVQTIGLQGHQDKILLILGDRRYRRFDRVRLVTVMTQLTGTWMCSASVANMILSALRISAFHQRATY
jgi:hypothetical protein